MTRRASGNKSKPIDGSKPVKARPGKREREDPSSIATNARGVMTLETAKTLLAEQKKPKTKKGERLLKSAGPQIVENTKRILILKGLKSSQTLQEVLKDIALLSKPFCKVFSRNNEVLPFEDANSLEYFGQTNDCSLIAFGSHNKKRPNNLVLGRLYDGHILDLFEFGVVNALSIREVTQGTVDHRTKGIGSKPMVVFTGDQWESDTTYQRIQSLLLDMFRGTKVEKLALKALDHVISCTVVDGNIYIRVYTVRFKKSGSKVPHVELANMGPFWDLSLRRTRLASDDLWKLACRQPKASTTKKVKNVSENSMGDKIGRLHIEKQDLTKMAVRRVDALRTTKRKAETVEEDDVHDNDNEAETMNLKKNFKKQVKGGV